MENHFPFHKLNDLQNMMSNIMAEGKENVWQYIEQEANVLKRVYQRNLYFEALNKLKKGKQNEN